LKIVNAFWEKRNLGVEAVEFVVEKDDNEAVISEILKNETQYNVVKLPVGKTALMASIQENGYRFAECMLNFTHSLSETGVLNAAALSNEGVSARLMTEGDFSALCDELMKGLFNTDRIYCDARFGPEVSARRYKNWLTDERAKSNAVYKLEYHGESIGFFALKEVEERVFDPFLIGLYNAYKGRGLGRSMAYCAMAECIKSGAKSISTHISSNNPANIRIYKSLGYEVGGVEYVFVKNGELKIEN